MTDDNLLERVYEYDLTSFEKVEEYQSSCTLRVQEHILQLHYHLVGKIDKLELNQKQSSNIDSHGNHEGERKIGLWERSCFEFFLKNKDKNEYFEFNFAPSGDWNCFYFPNRTQDLSEFTRIKRIPISVGHESIAGNDEFHLTALINLNHLGRYFYQEKQMRANLACILLNPNNGQKHHWALAHQQKRPNFHDFNSFHAHF